MTKPTPERSVEEIVEEFEMNFISLGVGSVDNPPKKLRTYLKELLQAERQKREQELQKTRTAEQERVAGIVEGKFDEPHEGTDDVTKEQSDYWVDGYNQALTDITEAIRGKENGI